MTERFDDLNAAALGLADAELSHIAETEQLDESRLARITARAMEKAGLAAAKEQPQPVIRHRKRTKLIGALIAAALSVTVLAGGVGAYLRYNKQLMEKRFGVLGTKRIEDLNVPEPKTFTNGMIDATVEAVLCDGNRAMVLITYKTVDPELKIDWDYQLYNAASVDSGDGLPQAYSTEEGYQDAGNTCLATVMLNLPEGEHSDIYKMRFTKSETNFPSDELVKQMKKAGESIYDLYESPAFVGSHVPYFCDLTDGLEIEIPLEQNVPTVTLRAEDGDTVTLSGFEMFSRDADLVTGTDYDKYDEVLKIYRNDGSVSHAVYSWGGSTVSEPDHSSDYSEIRFVEAIEGVKYRAGKPDTYIGFTDVSDVSAIEYCGTMYTRVD